MCTVATTGSVAIAGLYGFLEPLQAVGPELVEEVPQPREALRAHYVQSPLALRADRHQTRVPEHLQVLGDRLLSDVELLCDLVDRPRVVAHQSQDRPPVRVGECVERRLGHDASIASATSIDLYKCGLVTYTSLHL